jgi:hypothetical protein
LIHDVHLHIKNQAQDIFVGRIRRREGKRVEYEEELEVRKAVEERLPITGDREREVGMWSAFTLTKQVDTQTQQK